MVPSGVANGFDVDGHPAIAKATADYRAALAAARGPEPVRAPRFEKPEPVKPNPFKRPGFA
jgi:hypothetical protein